MFIKDASRQYAHKLSECKLLTHAYRDENGITRHRTILNLSKLPKDLAQVIIDAVHGGTMVNLHQVTVADNRSLGEVAVLKKLADWVGITGILKKHLGQEQAALALAMIFNRISCPKARYSLTEWLETTCLPELLSTPLSAFHYNRLYEAVKALAKNQEAVEKGLWEETKKHEENLTLMLYDITSSYLEGEQNELAAYGYSRDGKKGKKQLVIALVVTPKGRPVSVDVLKGNTADKTTLVAKINQLKKRFNVATIIYVFDQGMRDEKKLATLRSEHISYITALRRSEIEKPINTGAPIQLGMFDRQNLLEYRVNGRRYILCQSDQTNYNRKQRQNLLAKTEEKLAMIAKNVKVGRVKDEGKIAAWAEPWLRKWGMRKYFIVSIANGSFYYQRNQEAIAKSELLDQLYVLETTEKGMVKEAVQAGYKNLAQVEDAFRTLKSTLEVRPVHHRKENTVRGHIILCFLALYLKKELELKLEPLLKEENTFSRCLTNLREIRQSILTAGGYQTVVINQLNGLQRQVLSLLNMRIHPLPIATAV